MNELGEDGANPFNYGNMSNGNSSGGEDEDVERLLSHESLSSFITDSPFSFRNPIFFSVPRDVVTKKVEPLASKRHLFGD
jgi:hypothetical protein